MGYPLKVSRIRTEKLRFPTTGGKFGKNARGTRAHMGWDLITPAGTAVHAVGPGTITAVARNVPGYGHIIQLKFLKGATYYWALYGHLSICFASKGDSVREGQVLGLTGSTGNAKNQPPHLHFEISTSESLKRGRKNQIDPGEVIGRFLNDHRSGEARVIESSYPIDIEDVEAAERRGRTV